jgi:hypothetical protein
MTVVFRLTSDAILFATDIVLIRPHWGFAYFLAGGLGLVTE